MRAGDRGDDGAGSGGESRQLTGEEFVARYPVLARALAALAVEYVARQQAEQGGDDPAPDFDVWQAPN